MISYGIQKTEPLAVIKIRLVVLHAGAIAALFMPFNLDLLALFAATFFVRMIAVEAGYHRYFSHRSYKTSRWFQFVLGLIAASSGQRGPLWWAAHHRVHHRHSDQEGDRHSPRHGFWHSHVGWLIDEKNNDTNLDVVPDLARYPEMRLLNKLYHLPMLALLVGLAFAGARGWLGPDIGGWQAVLVGFFLSTALVLHVTLAVNSIAHLRGRLGGYRRFDTEDGSVNHAWLAIPTAGAAWHNNHHRYGAAARAGFAWYEIDLSYLALKTLEACRLIWDLREVPEDVLAEGGLGDSGEARAAT